MSDTKIIAVWGSGGSGKTTLSMKLAARLAGMNKDVIVVLTDVMAPDMNIILPFEKDVNSMGGLWATPDCSVEAIYNACVTTELDNVCLLGYKTGENVFSNPDYTKENIVKIFLMLKGLADYVIVDCVSSFAYNVLSTVALEIADKVIRLGEATPKSFSFFNSNLSLLADSRYKREHHIKVLSKLKDIYAKDAAVNFMGGIDAELPYLEDLEYQMLSGELLTVDADRTFKNYNESLTRLVDRLSDAPKVSKKAEVKHKEMRSFFKLSKAEVS